MSHLSLNLRNLSVVGFLVLLMLLLLFHFNKADSGNKTDSGNICLTMIVKNEEETIERCLDSARGVVDCISICDTGSSDRTVQIIEAYLEKNQIPGRVYSHEWKDFGQNRTLSFQAAQKTLQEQGFPLQNSFVLFLDADMVLQVAPDFDKKSLLHRAYAIEQKSQSHASYNLRMMPASEPWQCVGETYEYWTCDEIYKEERLETLKIEDRDDGECKRGNHEQDIRLLKQALEQDPMNGQKMFYLAQSLKAVKNYEEAIKWYQARIEKDGWNEEIWYSKVMLGECYQAMGQWEKALKHYLDAYEYLPERAESLQKISAYYRNLGENDLAYLFASQAALIPYPKQHSFYISYPVYEYLLDEDIAVSAFYTSYKEEGFAAVNRLMLKKNIPHYLAEQSHRNLLYYVQNLKDARFLPIEIDLPYVRKGLAAKYHPMNPSIVKTYEGYEVICRAINYVQIGAKNFDLLDVTDTTNTYRTRNFLVRYDRTFELISQQEITENLPIVRYKTRSIEGLEDCRVFEFENSTWFTCTTLDTNPTGWPQISLCKLSDDRYQATIPVEKLFPMLGPNPTKCEKNWMPFVKDGSLLMIYSCDPYIIYKPEIAMENGKTCQQIIYREENQVHNFSRFSGSAAPIEFDEGYLALVHETIYDDTKRNYTHRFVYLDNNLNFRKVSKPFTFLHKGIEFCCGMTRDHESNDLIMSIGIEDREAYLCFVSLDTVRSLLEPLPSAPTFSKFERVGERLP